MGLSLHVLIMEDDPTIRLALAHALKSRGVTVEICTSLESALEAIGGQHFDVILADLRMRGQESTDGLDLLKAVRRACPDTRVIIMTAYGTTEVEAEVHHHGGAYWAKSQDLDELLVSVTSVSPKPPRT
ncbi:MAG: response regulator [Candidatus Methylomirabilales bacterium]